MRSLIRLITSRGVWRASPFADLPQVPRNGSELSRHYFVLAGGLALILSRATRSELSGSLNATHMLYQVLRRELPLAGAHVEATLLGEAQHEIGDLADPRTKASLRFCYEYESRRAQESEASVLSAYPSSARSTRRPAPELDEPTQISTDVFDQRSQTLRKSVKEARGGTGRG